jgi:hypothetical protein
LLKHSQLQGLGEKITYPIQTLPLTQILLLKINNKCYRRIRPFLFAGVFGVVGIMKRGIMYQAYLGYKLLIAVRWSFSFS